MERAVKMWSIWSHKTEPGRITSPAFEQGFNVIAANRLWCEVGPKVRQDRANNSQNTRNCMAQMECAAKMGPNWGQGSENTSVTDKSMTTLIRPKHGPRTGVDRLFLKPTWILSPTI